MKNCKHLSATVWHEPLKLLRKPGCCWPVDTPTPTSTGFITHAFMLSRHPGAEWWHDERTMQAVRVEFGKLLYWELLGVR